MVDVQPGQVFVPGASAQIARQLINAAVDAGLSPRVVRTTSGGFVVPEAIDPSAVKAVKKKPAPRARRKKSTT